MARYRPSPPTARKRPRAASATSPATQTATSAAPGKTEQYEHGWSSCCSRSVRCRAPVAPMTTSASRPAESLGPGRSRGASVTTPVGRSGRQPQLQHVPTSANASSPMRSCVWRSRASECDRGEACFLPPITTRTAPSDRAARVAAVSARRSSARRTETCGCALASSSYRLCKRRQS
jgi:hypothetical protein